MKVANREKKLKQSGLITEEKESALKRSGRPGGSEVGVETFSLGRIEPPYPGWFSIHEARNRKKHVEDAGVVTPAAEFAKGSIQFDSVASGEIGRAIDSDSNQRRGDLRTDVGKIGQFVQAIAAHSGRMHV